MQWDVNLEEPISYNSTIGFILLIIAITIILLMIILKHLKIEKKPIVEEPPVYDLNKIKKEYLNRIDKLVVKINNNQITPRKAYNELSIIIREFTFKTTNIDVLKYTLFQIKQLNNQELTELLNEYYEPEFSKEGKGNLTGSIEKTRKVIVEWK